MTNKHTPGPWSYYTEPQPNGCPIIGARGLMVAMLAHSVNEKSQRDEALANARLIAAAPETAAERDRLKEINAELLAALVRISSDIDRQRRAGMNLSLLCLCTESLANAAIAKATGQALQVLADIGQELNI